MLTYPFLAVPACVVVLLADRDFHVLYYACAHLILPHGLPADYAFQVHKSVLLWFILLLSLTAKPGI